MADARYVKFTRPDGTTVWVNVNDPPRRIMDPVADAHAGNTVLVWASGDVQPVMETITQVLSAFKP